MGRFISTDPIGLEAGDTNLYRYVFNSPTNYTDPTGHEWDWGKTWNDFVGGVSNSLNAIGKTFEQGVSGLTSAAGNAWNNAGSFISQAGGAIGSAFTTAGSVANWAWKGAGSLIEEAAFAADKVIAGFADLITLGATTRIRESLYGDWVKEQHQGALFHVGQGLGLAAITVVTLGAGGLAAGGGAGARLATAVLRSAVSTGYGSMAFSSTMSVAGSLAYDQDHGGITWNSWGKAFGAGVNGAFEGFKGGAKFGALGPLGLVGRGLQLGMAVMDLHESATTTMQHLENGEYWSALVSAVGLIDSTKDAYHAGTNFGHGVRDLGRARQNARDNGVEFTRRDVSEQVIGLEATNVLVEVSSNASQYGNSVTSTFANVWNNAGSRISNLDATWMVPKLSTDVPSAVYNSHSSFPGAKLGKDYSHPEVYGKSDHSSHVIQSSILGLEKYGVNPLKTSKIAKIMSKSDIGKYVLKQAELGVIDLELSSASNITIGQEFGVSYSNRAIAYVRNTQTFGNERWGIRAGYHLTASILIHEGVHALGVGGSRRAEALARIAELNHAGIEVNRKTIRMVLEDINNAKVYDAMPWRINSESEYFPGVKF